MSEECGVMSVECGIATRGGAAARSAAGTTRCVRLGDVAEEVRGNWAGETKDVPVVGLEHLDPDDIWLRKWEVNPSENTFTKAFRKGQILFGRRRAYQKKLSLAPRDGICSGDITVIAAKGDKVVPELLPFFLRTDKFFDYAIQGSAGSLSPRVKWAHLADYEFDLPPIERQSELANLLWAANDLKESYKKAVAATDEMLKAKFREMFGGVSDASRGAAELRRIMKVSELFKVGSSKRVYQKQLIAAEEIPFYHVAELFSPLKETKTYIPRSLFYELKDKGLVPEEGDILISARGTLGKCYVYKKNDEFYFQDGMISWLSKRSKDLLLEYFIALMNFDDFRNANIENHSGSTVSYLSIKQLSNIQIPLPPLSLQREFVAIADKAESAKANLKKSIAAIDQVMKGLINH